MAILVPLVLAAALVSALVLRAARPSPPASIMANGTDHATHATIELPGHEPPAATGRPAPSEDQAGHGYIVPIGRSPIPQPGEHFNSPLPATRVGAKPVLKPMDDDRPPPISWDQAHEHVGQTITVQGTVVSANRRGKVCFLNFTPNWRGKFYVILFEGALAGWPQPPEQYFLNRTIRVWGKVSLHKDVPQLQVRSTRQITVLEDP